MSDTPTPETPAADEEIRQAVRDRYAGIVTEGTSCCGPSASSGCGCAPSPEAVSSELGYSAEELAAAPDGANLGLGCGNPTALADLVPGETVLDLGSGGGFDCFLAADRVGPTGHVIGVDMTPEMLNRARENASRAGHDNVEFRLGEIEHLPVADASVDAIISNCVVNLSPDKGQVFAEAFRVLGPGGRLMVSDIVLDALLPAEVAASLDAYTSCIAGAALRADYLAAIDAAGFADVEIVTERGFDLDDELFGRDLVEETAKAGIDAEAARRAAASVSSISVRAVKPV
jgi:SAM-dependent methyltransferase